MTGQSPPDTTPGANSPWRDRRLTPAERADALVPLMTLEEKIAQLVGVWAGADPSGDGVAPRQADMNVVDWATVIRHGLGQLTRPYGTAPVDPAAGARSLDASQREIMAANRFGIPAQVHEECLTGFSAWRATVYPAPLSWGASFDPGLIEEMAGRIGRSMRAAGVHQGLAPVLDVTRDYRWGRTEETIGEDPYLVGSIGAAYVRGLEGAGIVATLKHFAGYAASRGGRNLAPAHMGPRELSDVVLPPFEMALRLGGARSVMNSYAEIDGVPVAADESLLTGLLRDEWGFTGTVVADYFAVRFLQSLHGVAGDGAEAAGLALRAGIDVELPTVDTYGGPLVEAVKSGAVSEALIDRALRRVLTQKAELDLLDEDWQPIPDPQVPGRADDGVEEEGVGGRGGLRLDDEGSRGLALRLARESVVLVRNGGVLPLAAGRRVALVGPVADDPMAMLGCYAFPNHVGPHHPGQGLGLEIPSLREELAKRIPGLTYAAGCDVRGEDTAGIAAAVAVAEESDVCVLAVGDRAGLFGRGTSGEGCDATDLSLPGVQAELVRAVLATGTPVVLVLLAGRPYALGPETDAAAAVLFGFFPGQLGGRAVSEVLTGEVNPSGRLPVSVPRDDGGLPATYLTPPLGRRTDVSSVDPTPAFPFGHGLTYTTFEWTGAESGGEWPVDGETVAAVTVRNTGERPGAEVVQLYLHDPVAQTTRPVVRLIGYARVPLEPGEAARVTFTVHADLASFTGVRGRRIVEPGDVELRLSRSSADVAAALPLRLTGEEREVARERRLRPTVRVERGMTGVGRRDGAPEV
ncbi:glycoside hydrolase family 3 N-terminal domain-containing protein [Nonomuraea ferruginea]|uniref:Glycoside hydrolase family 3 C-terminal domain-containing protein n=2 Tax=Nonomuraea ferruginea TaxID=46174 RepID=A0ABT4SXF4_9ACTN|nr:glycoside hydrolase family 3 N-terminal domain-containing protein [Nonomuraea ferruginea]MDA0641785.1 glycoside hydrolase family 3 C-terminal domain-containing protein [Nonomuraea ferruginea]